MTYFIAHKLRHTPGRSFTNIARKIGVVTVASGLATIIIAFAMMRGFQHNIERRLTSFSGHLQVAKYTLNKSYEEAPLDSRRLDQILPKFGDAIKTYHPVAHKAALLQADEEIEGVIFKGISLAVPPAHLIPYLTAGQWPMANTKKYSQAVVLSHSIAAKLKLHVGDAVMLCIMQDPPRYRKLQVAGIYTSHVAPIDDHVAFCDLRLIQRLNGWNEYTVGSYEIFLSNISQIEHVSEQLLDHLDNDLDVRTIQDQHATIFDWLVIINKNAWIFMLIMLLVVCANMASIVLMQLTERIRMLGLLSALGATRWQIGKILLWQHLQLVGKGILWGNIIGIGLCLAQAYGQFIPLDATQYYMDHVPIALNVPIMVALNGIVFSVVMGAVSLFLLVLVRVRPSSALNLR